MLKASLFAHGSTEWTTPRWLFERLDQEFGFTLDPAATKENALCRQYFTQAQDGLQQDWGDHVVFLNPPYGRGIGRWVDKALSALGTVVMLLPARTDTKWFHALLDAGVKIRFVKGRLKFGEGTSSAPFPSIVAVKKGVVL